MDFTKEEHEILKKAVDIIKKGLEANAPKAGEEGSGSVSIYRFGTFKIVRAKARKARNPKTGGKVEIPERLAVRFHASKTWVGGLT